jgi:hypothetical protein
MANQPTEVPIPASVVEREILTDKYIQQWANALHSVNKTFTDSDIVRKQLAKCVEEGRLPDFPGQQKQFLSELMPNTPEGQRQVNAERTDAMAAVRATRKQKKEDATKPRKPKKPRS